MEIATTVRTFLTQSLSISGCEALTDSSLHALSSIAKNLKYFDCSGCFRSVCNQIMVVMRSRFLQINKIINIYFRFTGKALKDFTEGSLSLKPESISYCNEIQAKFDDGGDVDGEYMGGLLRKNCCSFGFCPNQGGGGAPAQIFIGPKSDHSLRMSSAPNSLIN